jgi:16S rRNA (guanine966-N2)-methyltransferase
VVPSGEDVRPTADRAREALLAILEHGTPPLRGCRFLDLFAGSGAVGLEAISRGAEKVVLVEQSRTALAALRANIATLGEADRARVIAGDASRPGRAPEPFDIVFLDPPYGSGRLVTATLSSLEAGGWLAPHARIVVELEAGADLPLPPGFSHDAERRYGRASFHFLRQGEIAADEPADEP